MFYLGLSVLAAASLSLAHFEVPPFGLISVGAWGAVVAATFAVVGAVHTYVNRRFRLGSDGPPPEVKYESESE